MEDLVNKVMKLIMKLSDVEAFAVPVLEKVLPARLAKSFFNEYTSGESRISHFTAKKLITECVDWISTEECTNALYSIYGPDANLPIPTHLTEKIQAKRCHCVETGYYESQCKRALLLINNNYVKHNLELDIDKNTEFGDWEERIWKKIVALASNKLQHVETCTEDHSNYFPNYKINPIDIALPYLANFKNLQSLKMDGIIFNDNHLVEIAQAVPNLKMIGFWFNKDLTISDVGVQALSSLSKLQELFIDAQPEFDDNEDEKTIYKHMNDFAKRCLKAMPTRLRIIKSEIDQYTLAFEHLIPKFEEPTDLALEHLFIREALKKECSNSTFANVHSLYISFLEDVNEANVIGNQKFSKLKKLCANGGDYGALTSLMPKLGVNLKDIQFHLYSFDDHQSVGLNFLVIIDSCPLLESILIHGGDYYFGHQSYCLQQIPLHLKTVHVIMDNPLDHSLPPGSLARLLQSPNLETVSLSSLRRIPSKDCFQLIEMLQSTNFTVLSNLKTVDFGLKEKEENEALSILLVAMATFCPRLSEICIENLKKGEVLNLCSRLLEKLITLKLT